jgi:hypothetical protein
MADSAQPGLVERLLTGFFAGWEPADKIAFCVIFAAFGYSFTGKLDAIRVLDYAFGYLGGRGVGGVGSYGGYGSINSMYLPPVSDGGNVKADG